MTDIIRKIINHVNLDEIYEYAKSSLFTNGPSSVTTLEIISYLSLFAPDFFDSIKDDVLSMMGVFYKKPEPVTLQGKLFELYGEYIQETYDFEYTPVQARACLINRFGCRVGVFSVRWHKSRRESFVDSRGFLEHMTEKALSRRQRRFIKGAVKKVPRQSKQRLPQKSGSRC